jgi:hypothetical protein
MPDIIRRVRFTPYRKGMGPTFYLVMWDTHRMKGNKCRLGYRLTMKEGGRKSVLLFGGEDYGCSPMHAIDSDAAVRSLMGFLTLRPGDTDREYFEDYTQEQLDYCSQHAETLGAEVYSRFGEG